MSCQESKHVVKMNPLHTIPVVLVSASPRRQEMLRNLKIRFKVFVPHVREDWTSDSTARRTALDLAIKKSQKYKGQTALVIAMDTIVVINQRKLGKPENAEEARTMLQLLSGQTHQVVTGTALSWRGRLITGVETTRVHFRKMTSREIEWYVQTSEPFDKAGAYAIQGLGRIFINRIDGCYYNVVGFPLALFQRLLRRFGLSIFDLQRFAGDR